MEELQLKLNNCLLKTIHFKYMGERCIANLNLTRNHMSSLRCRDGNIPKKSFMKIEKYLRDEGFFDIDLSFE
jgi:hypothetical protein